jgi:anti-sigma factor RsiW
MNETINSPACERASDLIAFLYNETNESETRDFELHLKDCRKCRDEMASFGVVRESITAWRDEALAGFVSMPLTTAGRKSAIAALRQFFDLAPLWLKGATAFAVVTFCVLAGLVILKTNNEQVSSTDLNPKAVYTQDDVNRLVKEALAKQENAKPPVAASDAETTVKHFKPQKQRPASTQFSKSRRPLSRAEREQLAADLRLLSTDDEASLHLLGDPINQ